MLRALCFTKVVEPPRGSSQRRRYASARYAKVQSPYPKRKTEKIGSDLLIEAPPS